MNLKTSIVYATLAITVASIGYTTYSLVRSPKDIKLTVQLEGHSCTYRICTSSTGLMTITLMTDIQSDWKELFHHHLMNAVTHGQFRNINEIIHFICSRHRDITTIVE